MNNSKLKKLLEQAWVKRRQEKYIEARAIVDEAYKLCDDDDYGSLGRIFHIYMQFESDHNNPSKALILCKKSLMYYKRSNNLNKVAHSTRHIADLERYLGSYTNAEQYYREAIHIYKNISSTSKGDLANALRGFGILLLKCNKNEEAITIWKETKELYQVCNLQAGVDEATEKLNLLL